MLQFMWWQRVRYDFVTGHNNKPQYVTIFSRILFQETFWLEPLILLLQSELSLFKPIVHIVNSFTDLLHIPHLLGHIIFTLFIKAVL